MNSRAQIKVPNVETDCLAAHYKKTLLGILLVAMVVLTSVLDIDATANLGSAQQLQTVTSASVNTSNIPSSPLKQQPQLVAEEQKPETDTVPVTTLAPPTPVIGEAQPKQRKCNYTAGYWKETGLYQNLGEAGKYRDHGANLRPWMVASAKKASRWDWILEDSTCSLSQFNREAFCDALNGRNILFVGDSITHLQARSLWLLMNGDSDEFMGQTYKANGLPTGKFVTVRICGGKILASYARNDLLTLGKELFYERYGLVIPWTQKLQDYDILVLNDGAHFHPHMPLPPMYGNPRKPYEEAMHNASAYLETHYNGTVIFRTTPRGHLGCQRDSKVIPSKVNVNSTRYFRPSKLYENYYGSFPLFNAFVHADFGRLNNAIILDVARMTEYRPDSHLNPPHDCLHYILPGTIDQWNWLLFHALQGNLEAG